MLYVGGLWRLLCLLREAGRYMWEPQQHPGYTWQRGEGETGMPGWAIVPLRHMLLSTPAGRVTLACRMCGSCWHQRTSHATTTAANYFADLLVVPPCCHGRLAPPTPPCAAAAWSCTCTRCCCR